MPNCGFGSETEVQTNGNGKDSALPSFFIIGPPRTGTTWLHQILSECTWLAHPTKETRFFDKYFDCGLEWYKAHYRKAGGERMIGEVAPTYFASALARQRIAQTIPHARVVCTFRNPVDRIVSLYRLKRAYGLIPWNFEEALARDPELLESNRYAAHLKEWRNTLGDSQLLVTVHEDIERDPQTYLNRIVDFIGVPRITLAAAQKRRVLTSDELTEPRSYSWTRAGILLAEWLKARRLDSMVATAKRVGASKLFVGGGPAFPELTASQRVRLRQMFRPEVEELEEMLNRDFSEWK
ncbi:MAG: sulfotransferase [Candidatus Sulfotelmatobacter sp.]